MGTRRESILLIGDSAAVSYPLYQNRARADYQRDIASRTEPAIDERGNSLTELLTRDVISPNVARHKVQTGIGASYFYVPVPREREFEASDYPQHLEWIKAQMAKLRKSVLGFIASLTTAVEAVDECTARHSQRVTKVALTIGRELGLYTDELEYLRWGSLLHDIGKIAVDPCVKNKPGKLNPKEYQHIKLHAHVGASIVRPIVNEIIAEMIEHHHDHYDGNGHHQTTIGADIPLGARIITVADAFDAMVSDRPYRGAVTKNEALAEIVRCTDTQFDPKVVTVFQNIMEKPSPLPEKVS